MDGGVTMDDVVKAIFRALKELGADCSRYAPIAAPSIRCKWNDGIRVEVFVFMYREEVKSDENL